ncbi:N-Dimethylarginine dimethylaminohydrolase [Haloechinothrix alba]|uniref:N-Dimethylarginine dimethylaminohydrolase n=2 Tax=Haloechinothrix alba TaxID=664784 RepID=A0A238YGN8_9PSEU|nr:N-Dimethylarginine dimethylaminohydrolase [Haloechinothrix alba]
MPVSYAREPVPTTRRFLMCPPRYFAVRYVINPWMNPDRPVDADRAMEQWSRIRAHYIALGHKVEEIEPQPGLPDMVFAANAATVLGGTVLGARFRNAERAPEAEHYRRWFLANGYRDIVMPTAINEAEGDFVWTGRELLAGTGFRTEPGAHAEAQEVLGAPVVSLQLVDPHYYHLDTALFVLSPADESGQAVIAYYPDAFSAESRGTLERMFPDAVLAGRADAEAFGLNAISDGRTVILPREAEGLAASVAARGYQPLGVDISELRKAGGGPKCCTLELREG